jgi:fusaric acid resistance family protein
MANTRRTIRERAAHVARLSPAIGQTALAASLAWEAAVHIAGHRTPFFAPVAAIIGLGVVLNQRAVRAVQIVAGVCVGVLVADLIVIGLGTGPLQIALVTALAMTIAIASGGAPVLVGQAATSAVLVATIDVPDAVSLSRTLDALVGSATALAVGLILLPLDPRSLVRRPLAQLGEDLGAAIDRITGALASGDHDAAIDALDTARTLDATVTRYAQAVGVGRELCTLAPLRRRQRPALERHAVAATHLDFAARNVRAIARATVRAVDLAAHVPPEEHEALMDLARALRALPAELEAQPSDGTARESALRRAALSTLALERTGNLSLSVLTGLIRSAATDVLRALGVPDREAAVAVRRAAAELTATR